MLKEIKHLSPSSISTWDNIDDFVKMYMLDPPLPRMFQSNAMSLGSGFDAFVKNELARCIYGGSVVTLGQPYHLETLFKKQVGNPDDHSWCWEESGYLFLKYKDHGAFDELLMDLEDCTELQFEEPITKKLVMPDKTEVTIKGIPDCTYRHRNGQMVILDWKCNGFRSNKKSSPYKHYVKERPNGRSHINVVPREIDGLYMQDEFCFSECNEKWATQLAIYGWLRGEEIGSPFIAQIEQILCDPGETHPESRSITYRGYITPEFQYKIADKISTIWNIIKSGHIFQELTREESDARLENLGRYNNMVGEKNPVLDIIKGVKNG